MPSISDIIFTSRTAYMVQSTNIILTASYESLCFPPIRPKWASSLQLLASFPLTRTWSIILGGAYDCQPFLRNGGHYLRSSIHTRAGQSSWLTKQRVVIKKNFQNFAMRTSTQNLISIFLHSIRARNVQERQPEHAFPWGFLASSW